MESPSDGAGMPTVLVTGASGFTGRYLVDALQAEDYRVVGFGTGETHAQETVQCDLIDASEVRQTIARIRPDYVVHLAALSFVGHENPEAFYRVNLFGTLNLLDALSDLDAVPKKVIVASSANVYGANAREVIDEGVCPAPVNHYACSKLAMEHMASTWFDRLPTIITRPFNYTGPGQDEHFLVPKIAAHYARREPVLELGNLDVSRDFSDVRDVTDAYRLLLRCDTHSEWVNVCSGEPRSLKSILESCGNLTGHRPEIRVNPDFVRANEISVLAGDPSRLTAMIGERELIPFERTLADLCQSLA